MTEAQTSLRSPSHARQAFSSVISPLQSDRSASNTHTSHAHRDPGTLFRSLVGDWHVRRKIHHGRKSKGIDGRFEGTATFFLRAPTADKPEEGMQEYLYREHGTFTTATGTSFPAQMKYVYRYHPASTRISVWRVKPGASAALPDAGDVDDWFHDILLDSETSSDVRARASTWFADHRDAGSCAARGSEHLCVRDLYKPFYRFCFKGDELVEFGVGYEVSGPKKDYTSEAWYERS
ncbi:uncharacterized protein LAESUDRAFT_810851 [Laetiporus sulphureus 93-53]|uniref:DUF6314 domain-containing protein n=1 Tax=Laetiporus sulphureus 93-53 TaxID=1314785 RepID=A0A165FN91_9APHY|nr:uncharacterized protein LAESUDRAFT_810851 [Laetiporus sulphureus 93-53]KZT09223.1 hypothetical protein LAESUDRAFT_810851 [Laetiporus sulphureus 93-53]